MALHGRIDKAPNEAAIVLIAHGYAEHLGRYDELVKHLNRAGLTCYRYDHEGHGKSEGKRARVDVNDLVRQHYRVRQQIRAAHPSTPLFLLGHSMGGLITAASAVGRPDDIAGVILSSPALGTNPSLSGPVSDALYEVSKFVPSIPVAPFKVEGISRTQKVVDSYLEDPLNYVGPVQMLTGASMMALGHRVMELAPRWTPDTLILQGDRDDVVSVSATREFASKAGTEVEFPPTIDYVEVPEAYHEIFNEPEGPVMMTLVAQWIKDQL
ncbi:hypothetical protein BSR29_01700 [Boudabousia liubingyangii]|uniref:Serine aminopeptidase S33 domain-containing protein n=1 Tax=Boudabousia liubingyangii TaxID=1921764 RepID=A0A1Q5PQL1_9ACTO|nr:alpha/beta hydrolase [Boudabousia liubingyangii]OKL48274.1 hypothetical protein BSR28_00750 [Boudabousia liubingyangii]OKL49690.1 hypothetical protein BSR29_01700 [Boudabousia liubingyangii]